MRGPSPKHRSAGTAFYRINARDQASSDRNGELAPAHNLAGADAPNKNWVNAATYRPPEGNDQPITPLPRRVKARSSRMVEGRKRRRLVATAIGGTSLAIVATSAVVARGPNVGSPYEILTPYFSHPPTARSSTPTEVPAPAHSQMTAVTGRPVCVRLCDGAYFPVSNVARATDDEAICRGLCPDADTAVYLEPKRSDDIADAVSKTGHPYSELPTALRYRTAFDATCVCHRDVAPHYSLAEDSTLRKGDVVMTSNGPTVFDGAASLPHRAGDFVALTEARLPAKRRVELQALQGPHSVPRGSVRITTP